MASPFHLENGKTAATISELRDQIALSSQNTVEYHLQRDPNDFSQWILSLGNEGLAEAIKNCTTAQEIVQELDAYLLSESEPNLAAQQAVNQSESVADDLAVQVKQDMQTTKTDASDDVPFYKRKVTQEFLLGMLTGAIIAVIIYRAVLGI